MSVWDWSLVLVLNGAIILLVPNGGQDGQYMVTEQVAENKKGQAS